MKVLSLYQPYAQIIKSGIKKIETRSWKTNYRGKLYIHASMTKLKKEDKENKKLMALVGDADMDYGTIICECDLVDCIEMTEDFIAQLKVNNPDEYNSGFYSPGRYAWILDNVKICDPIKAKGHLGIWNY